MKIMKVGLFFGSFNPIHIGHLLIANHIANFETENVWFIVSPQNPFKETSELLPANLRLRLVQISTQKDQRFKTLDIEFNLPLPSYTINTLEVLNQMHPEHEFYLVMGSDNLLHLTTWKSAQKIIEDFKIIVYERPGYPVSTPTHANISVTKAPLLDISSTYIRNLRATHKNISYLLPEAVHNELIINTMIDN
jgi:nicotinate-nucleotide adenylyltransferase